MFEEENVKKSPWDSKLEVKALNINNLDACVHLDKIALDGIWSQHQWKEELSDSKRLCLGGFKRSQLIAVTTGWIVLDEIQITAVAVHPGHRKLGFGKILLSELLKRAKSAGVIHATLEVRKTNIAANALYKSLGFKTQGYRHYYYKDGSDANIKYLSLESYN